MIPAWNHSQAEGGASNITGLWTLIGNDGSVKDDTYDICLPPLNLSCDDCSGYSSDLAGSTYHKYDSDFDCALKLSRELMHRM